MNEREERYQESLGGIFGIFQKNWSVFFKKTPVKWFSKNHFKCFSRFSKVFFKFAKHFIFIPKTLKSVFKGINTFKNHCQTGSKFIYNF